MDLSRRKFSQLLGAGALVAGYSPLYANDTPNWHESIAKSVRQLVDKGPLHVSAPIGSMASVKASADEFTRMTGVICSISETAVDETNVELLLQSHSRAAIVDVALVATSGLPDLIEAQAIMPLNDFAERYQPSDFGNSYLYRKGDHFRGKLYGYQTDGDCYLLFYNKRLLEDPLQSTAFEEQHGRALGIARTWQELDEMMAFFHQPDIQQYGGCLFRNASYLVWEWWARFHAKGFYPLQNDMTPNINNEAGVAALEELIAASQWQSPRSRSNGLFENWNDFANGNIFCNIGWGGTQKHMMTVPSMRDNLIYSSLPALVSNNGQTAEMGYFNWGWNYTVSTQSKHQKLAYLLTLFCTTPSISTLAVQQPLGFLDPFRQEHYQSPGVQSTYGQSFLDVHYQSLNNCIPDLYIRGQSSYLDALRQQIMATLNGETNARRAMDVCAQRWNHLTRRLGARKQSLQWRSLKASYPSHLQALLEEH